MFETVIVGISDRDEGRTAVALARALAPDGELLLVHAYPFESATSRALTLGYGHRLREDAEHYMREVAEESGLDAHRAEVVADTSPARALHAAAERHHADLIVVGSAHRGRVGRALLGDVSRGVLHDAPCPVAVAPRGWAGERVGVIGVGFDGSAEATAALSCAASIAGHTGARLRVVDVVDLTWPIWSRNAYRPDVDGVEEELLREARESMERATRELTVPSDEVAVVGFTATELAQLASEVDLMVVGSRGYGPVKRTVLGSTSDRLIHGAPCPVVVVARGSAADGRGAPRTGAHATA